MGGGRRKRAAIFPLEGVDQVGQVFLEEIVNDAEGVFVGGGIKIKGAAEKVAGGIGEIELLGGGGIPADGKKDTPYAVGRLDDGRLDRAGLISMFIGHFEGIVAELVKRIAGAFGV